MGTASDNPDGLTWTVTGQADVTDIASSGRAVAGVSVTFTTPTGDNGSVFVPREAFNANNVRAAILAKVQAMHDVAGLTS